MKREPRTRPNDERREASIAPADLPSAERITSPSERLEVRLAGLVDLLAGLTDRLQDEPLAEEAASRLVHLAKALEDAILELAPRESGNA